MHTHWIFLKIIQAACQSGAMMGTMCSSLIVRSKESIEWNCQSTIPWIHTLIWMKDAHPCLQNTWGRQIAEKDERSCIFPSPLGSYDTCGWYHTGFSLRFHSVQILFDVKGTKMPREKLVDVSLQFDDQRLLNVVHDRKWMDVWLGCYSFHFFFLAHGNCYVWKEPFV